MKLFYISYLSDGTDDLKKALFESENIVKIYIFQIQIFELLYNC